MTPKEDKAQGHRAVTITADGVRLAVRLSPGASRDRIEDFVPTADGGMHLKVSVTTVPENGKANAALIALLAKSWRIPQSSIAIVRGQTDRRKVLSITGDLAGLRAFFQERGVTLP